MDVDRGGLDVDRVFLLMYDNRVFPLLDDNMDDLDADRAFHLVGVDGGGLGRISLLMGLDGVATARLAGSWAWTGTA